ncbi:GNAT family N-acetyltransferase [Ureibacillus chungkukjangi]|nr:GNAT family N-acetyltransferase [Ureibacillus chungkukjangi]
MQQLEVEVWGHPPIPIHQTLTAIKNGGIVVGAFEGEKLVGVSYSFPGYKKGKVHLTSHILGISKNVREKGIGEALKWEQRKIAIERGYDMMLWTYDPLETRNGYLNLTKLHTICDTYIENCYGEMQDGLNKGLPSDRFEVNWHLTSKYVEKKHAIDLTKASIVAPYKMNDLNFPVLAEVNSQLLLEEDVYLLPVPQSFQQLKATDPKLALDWRLKTRSLIQMLFSNGYAAVRLEKGKDVHYYQFIKRELIELT